MTSEGQTQKVTESNSCSFEEWYDDHPWLRPLEQLLRERHYELQDLLLAKMSGTGVVFGAQRAPDAMLGYAGQKEAQAPDLLEDTSDARIAASGSPGKPQRSCSRTSFKRITPGGDYEALAEARSMHRQLTRENRCLEEAEVGTDVGCHGKITALVESKYFEGFFACLIITNSLVIGAQVEHASYNVHYVETPLVFRVLEQLYAFLFFVELVLRMVAGGRSFFCSSDPSALFWSYFDMLIVSASVFELVVQVVAAVGSESQDHAAGLTRQAKTLRVVRITRVIRVMRVLRVVKFVRSLSTLISSIFCTLKALAWSLFLLLMIVYMFGILFADTVLSHVAAFPNKNDLGETSEEYQLYTCFGSLLMAMHTLFRSISGGIDWGQAIDLLFHIHWAWGYLFLAYIAFCYFAVLNVMTAVFCQRAIESSRYDPDYQIQQMSAEQERCSEMCAQLFSILDSISDGTITRAELVEHFEEDSVRALFQSLDLVATDPWTLFKLLDENSDGDIDHAEFMLACMRMRGPAKSVDIAWLMHESTDLRKDVKSLQDSVRGIAISLHGLHATISWGQGMQMQDEASRVDEDDDEKNDEKRHPGPAMGDMALDRCWMSEEGGKDDLGDALAPAPSLPSQVDASLPSLLYQASEPGLRRQASATCLGVGLETQRQSREQEDLARATRAEPKGRGNISRRHPLRHWP